MASDAEAALRILLGLRETELAQDLRRRAADAEAELARWRRGGELPVLDQYYELTYAGLDAYHFQQDRPILKYLGDGFVDKDEPNDQAALPSQDYVAFDPNRHADKGRGMLFATALETLDATTHQPMMVNVQILFPTRIVYEIRRITEWSLFEDRPYIDSEGRVALSGSASL